MTERLVANGFDDAFIGVGRQGPYNEVSVYNYEKCVKILMRRDGMSRQEAEEFMEYNVVGSWVGEKTPVFVEKK